MTDNPMQAFCGAHCRTTGEPCKNHKMENGRCRMHGGKSPGRPVINGRYTREAVGEMAKMRKLNRDIRELLRSI